VRLAFLRHGPTDWNEEGRIQGRLDMPLSAAGRTKMAGLMVPQGFETARAFTSPLGRARETAKLLGFADAVPDARLSEHHWGEWEGLTREEILARDGADAFARAGAAGDFTPKGGESTRDLLARVADFIRDADAGEARPVGGADFGSGTRWRAAHRGAERAAQGTTIISAQLSARRIGLARSICASPQRRTASSIGSAVSP
jgi:broad specificity phosphatase PhoE